MKTLIALLALSWSVTLNADVIIYKFLQTNVWTGDGATIKQRVAGRLVFDRDTLAAKVFTELPQLLRFQIDCPQFDVKYMDAPKIVDGRVRGRISQAAFFIKGDGYNLFGKHVSNMQAFWRGANSLVLIGTDNYVSVPKILKGSYQGSYISAGGATAVGQANVIASFMGAETIAANNARQTVQGVINSWIELANSHGYTEVSGDVPCLF